MSKKIVSLSILIAASMVSLPALATTASNSKTVTAETVTIYSNGIGTPTTGLFTLLFADFPLGVLSKTKTLTSFVYSAAVSLCKIVMSGVTSTTTDLNRFIFGAGASVRIIHAITGAPGSQLKSSRQESVTFKYGY